MSAPGASRDLVLLGGYAAKQCARRVHNDHDPTLPQPVWEVPAELQARFDAGDAFEKQVFRSLEVALGDRCVRVADAATRARIEATVEAMDRGVPVILGGQLPHDERGARVGKPDLLVRWPGSGAARYVPADVKHHRVTKPVASKKAMVSRLSDPAELLPLGGAAVQVASRFDDYLQLAHYTRMLEAAGRHPGPGAYVGAIIGSDDLTAVDPSGHALVWLDLALPQFTSFSRARGRKKRTALERYDHEHKFRVKVAVRARSRTGGADDPAPLVAPVRQPECDLCAWWPSCRDILGEDPSVSFTTGQLDVREWLALRDAGVETAAALAEVDVDDGAFQSTYLPQVSHQPRALERLAAVVTRARLIRDGFTLQRTTAGPLRVPQADVEIDLDIEWDPDDRVYLWGALLTSPDAATTYHSFVSWDPLTEETERLLARAAAGWLEGVVVDARSAGRSVRIFHYSTPEPRYLQRILGAEEVRDLLGSFEDLLPVLRENFLAVHGLSIKKVAPVFGFKWRDDDPGGLQSQTWLTEARESHEPGPREAARTRILEYNEDDVRATAALRSGLRALAASGAERV